MHKSQQVLYCQGLQRRVNGTSVLDIGELELERGRTYLLSGANGAGKTTLLRVLAGLEPALCERVVFNGEPVQLHPYPRHMRAQLAFVHHHPVMFSMSVAANIAYGLRCTGLSHTEIARRCDAAIEWAGIGSLGSRSAHALSAGERQRVALARAHVLQPLLYLLDEPTANLDGGGRELVVRLIDAIRQEGRTLLVACHDRELLNLAGVVRLHMSNGRMDVQA